MGVYIKGITSKQLMKVLICSTEFLPNDCEITEIPEPHGRLIDADVLSERLMANWLTADESGKKIIHEVLTDVVTPIVVGTPTVIEAEGE